MMFISRQSSIEHIYSNIVQAWNQRRQRAPDYSCHNCRAEQASPRELAIAFELMRCPSVAAVARKLHISEKTVYAHKYSLMKKFHLINKKDFCNLLTYLRMRGDIGTASATKKTHPPQPSDRSESVRPGGRIPGYPVPVSGQSAGETGGSRRAFTQNAGD
ncbi:LuxR C-terminal-related transcriptional regulator [Klebsiella aerogenes]|uniref:helix-turn-helix transcriptional regulator n=1 Tax=Klebsiella aerogenes TaxID=548 RepID=UPI003D7EBD73